MYLQIFGVSLELPKAWNKISIREEITQLKKQRSTEWWSFVGRQSFWWLGFAGCRDPIDRDGISFNLKKLHPGLHSARFETNARTGLESPISASEHTSGDAFLRRERWSCHEKTRKWQCHRRYRLESDSRQRATDETRASQGVARTIRRKLIWHKTVVELCIRPIER